jgi:hypothetical protein
LHQDLNEKGINKNKNDCLWDTIKFSKRKFTEFKETDLAWAKFRDLGKYKRRKYAPQVDYDSEPEAVKKE